MEMETIGQRKRDRGNEARDQEKFSEPQLRITNVTGELPGMG
jgi:hypothetical protein